MTLKQSRKITGKCRCSESLDDQKLPICAKVGVKFYDNVEIKLDKLGRGEGVKSGGAKCQGLLLQLGTVGDGLDQHNLQAPGVGDGVRGVKTSKCSDSDSGDCLAERSS